MHSAAAAFFCIFGVNTHGDAMRQWHQAEPRKVLCIASVTAGKTACGYSDFANAVDERNGNCTKKASGQDDEVQEAYFESGGPVAESCEQCFCKEP